MQLKYPESPIQTLQLNFDLTEKELVDQIVKMKENYKLEQSSIFNFEEKLNQDYLNQVNEVLKKFPKSFMKKQDLIIKALFAFDFIQAKKLDIDYKNQQIKVKIQAERIRIEQKYKKLIDKKNIEKQIVKNNPDSVESTEQEINKLLREQKRELKKNENRFETKTKTKEDKDKEQYHKYPKMNTKYEDNIFNEISELLKETIGQIKKIHNHIHKFLEKKII
jgi:phage-related minor tail protein